MEINRGIVGSRVGSIAPCTLVGSSLSLSVHTACLYNPIKTNVLSRAVRPALGRSLGSGVVEVDAFQESIIRRTGTSGSL